MEHAGRHDVGDDGVAGGGTRTGAGGQDARSDRSSVRGSPRGCSRPGLVARRLRSRRTRLRGTLATPRRGDWRAPGAVARERRAVRRALLLDRGLSLEPAPAQPGGPADLGGQLGLGGRAAPCRAPRRRLARIGVQHDAGAVRPKGGLRCGRSSPTTGRSPTTSRTRSRRCGATSRTTATRPTVSSIERLVPTVHRPDELLRERLPIGPPELFAEKLTDFAEAGVQRVYIWPVADEVEQLERFWNDVRPLVAARSPARAIHPLWRYGRPRHGRRGASSAVLALRVSRWRLTVTGAHGAAGDEVRQERSGQRRVSGDRRRARSISFSCRVSFPMWRLRGRNRGWPGS